MVEVIIRYGACVFRTSYFGHYVTIVWNTSIELETCAD